MLLQFTIENTGNSNIEMVDDVSDKMESREKVLFEAIDLIESFALLENDDIAKQLRKHAAQLNALFTSLSRFFFICEYKFTVENKKQKKTFTRHLSTLGCLGQT